MSLHLSGLEGALLMDAGVTSALIGASAGLIGVLVGGVINYHIQSSEIVGKRRSVESLSVSLLLDVREMLMQISDPKVASDKLIFGETVNDTILEVVEETRALCAEHSPRLAICLLWVKQACGNVRIYADDVMKGMRVPGNEKKMQELLGYMAVDAKRGVRLIDKSIISHYFESRGKSRSLCRRCDGFDKFLETKFGEQRFKRWMFLEGFVSSMPDSV